MEELPRLWMVEEVFSFLFSKWYPRSPKELHELERVGIFSVDDGYIVCIDSIFFEPPDLIEYEEALDIVIFLDKSVYGGRELGILGV